VQGAIRKLNQTSVHGTDNFSYKTRFTFDQTYVVDSFIILFIEHSFVQCFI
jgi:hypothetical protein